MILSNTCKNILRYLAYKIDVLVCTKMDRACATFRTIAVRRTLNSAGCRAEKLA